MTHRITFLFQLKNENVFLTVSENENSQDIRRRKRAFLARNLSSSEAEILHDRRSACRRIGALRSLRASQRELDRRRQQILVHRSKRHQDLRSRDGTRLGAL